MSNNYSNIYLANLFMFRTLIGVAALLAIVEAFICNIGLPTECVCSAIDQSTPGLSCVDLAPSDLVLDTVLVKFAGCHSSALSGNDLQEKLSLWLREECANYVQCDKVNVAKLSADHVVLTWAQCNLDPMVDSGFAILVIGTETVEQGLIDGKLNATALVNADSITTMLRSRMHLLEMHMGSHITDIERVPMPSVAYEKWIRPLDTSSGTLTSTVDMSTNMPTTSTVDRNETNTNESEFFGSPMSYVLILLAIYLVVVWAIACYKIDCIRQQLSSHKHYMSAPLIVDTKNADDIQLCDMNDASQRKAIVAGGVIRKEKQRPTYALPAHAYEEFTTNDEVDNDSSSGLRQGAVNSSFSASTIASQEKDGRWHAAHLNT